jgi:carboxyl-terminal processing protease
MKDPKLVRILLLLLCAQLALPRFAARAEPQSAANSPVAAVDSSASHALRIMPNDNDGRIAYTTAIMLTNFHYLHLPFDAQLSSKFLDSYLHTLDPQHLHFLQSDLTEFDQYRTNLNELTQQKITMPAYVIYDRFMQRLEERSAYAKELLANEAMEFDGSEIVSLNRKEAKPPKDMAEARQLWRERLRWEYLQEKLNKEGRDELARLWLGRHNLMAVALTWRDFHQEIVTVIEKRYNRVLRNFRDYDSEKVLETYLTALAHVYDPHSDYSDKESLENFSIEMSRSLFGIGAQLSTDDSGYCKIMSLTADGPAIKSKKLKAGDRIVAVAQGPKEAEDVIDMPLTKVVDKIRGEKGTEVRLTIIPADAVDPATRTTISLVRDEIKLEGAKGKIIEFPGKDGSTMRVGVIDLPAFYASFPLMGSRSRAEIKSATIDVDRLLEKMKDEHVSGVILDLRNNGGGSLDEAINLTGLFIKQGPVVQVASANGDKRVDKDLDPSIEYDGPLVVMTSRFSASASEIVAGALQDYDRALLVGDKSTHGKGTVQSMSQLAPYIYLNTHYFTNNPVAFGALKYTTNKFYRITGSSTQLKGVTPDIVLPSIRDYLEVGEASLENALPWDTIEKVDYDKLNRVRPFASELEKRSEKRVAAAKDFEYVREDIEVVKKAVADRTVSLNEKQRLKEAEEAEARRRVRDAELKARKLPEKKVYDLNIKNNVVVMTQEKDPWRPGLAMTPTSATSQVDPDATKPAKSPGGNAVASVPTGSATNAAASVSTEETEADKLPQIDVGLEETENILLDYIALLQKNADLTRDSSHTPVTLPNN